MKECLKFYINGAWVAPLAPKTMDVINPATEEAIGRISLGSAADVDKAVAAARAAFETFGRTSPQARIALLERVIAAYKARLDEIAETISLEMGAPLKLAKAAQAPAGLAHFTQALELLRSLGMVEPRFRPVSGRLLHPDGSPRYPIVISLVVTSAIPQENPPGVGGWKATMCLSTFS